MVLTENYTGNQGRAGSFDGFVCKNVLKRISKELKPLFGLSFRFAFSKFPMNFRK